MSLFIYWGFGLHITSEIPFPELYTVPPSAPPDVTITLGDIPHIPTGETFSTGQISYIVNDHEILMTVPTIATYHITNGTTIIISPHSNDITPRMLRVFVLAGAMAAILRQRHTIPMHAASILKNDTLTFISGHSGAGKSTTLAGLIQQQYPVFSDDVTVLSNNNHPHIHGLASYPMIKLWEQSMQSLHHTDRSFPIMPGMEKYGVFFHEDFNTNAYPVTRLILLTLSEDDRFTTSHLTGGEAFSAVMQHVYKPSFFNSKAMRILRFTTITKLLQHADVYEIARPQHCHPGALLSHVTALI
jgi:hypothetical protein